MPQFAPAGLKHVGRGGLRCRETVRSRLADYHCGLFYLAVFGLQIGSLAMHPGFYHGSQNTWLSTEGRRLEHRRREYIHMGFIYTFRWRISAKNEVDHILRCNGGGCSQCVPI